MVEARMDLRACQSNTTDAKSAIDIDKAASNSSARSISHLPCPSDWESCSLWVRDP
jgi:hypothetical protein